MVRRMRRSWTRLLAGLGVAALALCQSGTLPVKAGELTLLAESKQPASESGYQAISNIRWAEDVPGKALFDNLNSNAWVRVDLYKDGEKVFGYVLGKCPKGALNYDFYHTIEKLGTGTYTFEAAIISDSYEDVLSGQSAGFDYTVPEEKLPAPATVNAGRDGVVSCALSDDSGYTLGEDYRFGAQLYYRDSEGYHKKGYQTGSDEKGVINFSEYMTLDPGKVYYVRVLTQSEDVTKWLSSDWSDYIPLDPDAAANIPDANEEEQEEEEERQEQQWEPSTPDELKRFAACGSEEIVYTADAKNAYSVTIQNSAQGEMCWVSIEAALGGYTVGRTYNIFPSDEIVYKMDSKARITLSIPEALQADNREFRMISVTENGRPVVLKDLDSDSKTITFETDTYYAFALVYKDTAKKK